MSSHQNNNNHNADSSNQAFLQSHGKEKKKPAKFSGRDNSGTMAFFW
jgi:hypothetical protein